MREPDYKVRSERMGAEIARLRELLREAWACIDPTGFSDIRARIESTLSAATGNEVTHQCPPDGSGTMPCCGETPFSVPRTDKMTTDPKLVTCHGTGRSGGTR